MTEETVQEIKPKRPPGRPKKAAAVPFTETVEFKDAVTAAASKAAAEILANLQANQGGVTRQGDASFAEGLALAIAQLSHQGVGTSKKVDPAVLKARDDARKLMTERIMEARTDGQVPLYELRNKIYFDETMVDPVYVDPATKEQRPTQIEWPGVPNEAMIPANDVAKGIHAAFSDSIGVAPINDSKHIRPETLSVTGNGLVVRGASGALRPMQVGNQTGRGAGGEGMVVHGARSQTAKTKTINVLGTVADPARVGA